MRYLPIPFALLLTLTGIATAQTTGSAPAAPTAPCTPPDPTASAAQQSKPCPPQAKKSSPAEQFPFPGETAPAQTPDSTPDAPSAPTPSHSGSAADAAKEHPFPTGATPSLPGEDPGSSSSSGSGSSSSSSGSSSSADDETPLPRDTGAEGTSVHRKLPKPAHIQSDDERVDEDLYVAKFYMRDDNLAGALLRAKDAVKTQPEYSNAHFMLAQVLEKMKKKDEAAAEYEAYLKLDPDGDHAKAAKQALNDLK